MVKFTHTKLTLKFCMYALQVFLALTMAAIGISQTSSFAPDSSKAKNAATSIFAILDLKSKIDPSEESGIKLDDVKGEIELHHISFKYPSRPDIHIFRDLNLKIHSGKVKFNYRIASKLPFPFRKEHFI